MLMLSSLDTPMDNKDDKASKLGKRVNDMRGTVAPGPGAAAALAAGAAI
jgi:hypothetical protein